MFLSLDPFGDVKFLGWLRLPTIPTAIANLRHSGSPFTLAGEKIVKTNGTQYHHDMIIRTLMNHMPLANFSIYISYKTYIKIPHQSPPPRPNRLIVVHVQIPDEIILTGDSSHETTPVGSCLSALNKRSKKS